MSSKTPLVSVRMSTYNHEKFISQAIEGVLMQKTDFPFELIIGEDCSTDRTRETVVDYANRYPDIIKPILHEKNVGMTANGRACVEACRGKYIAICEGDDYWIDHTKLQIQVSFLEKHPECVQCHTRALVVNYKGESLRKARPSRLTKKIAATEDILKRNFIVTATCMYRSGYESEKPEFANSFWAGDWTKHIMDSRYGFIGFIPKITAAYRLNPNGATNKTPLVAKMEPLIRFYGGWDEYFESRYSRIIEKLIARTLSQLAFAYAENGNMIKSKELFKYALRKSLINNLAVFQYTRAFLRIYCPRFYNILLKMLVRISKYYRELERPSENGNQ